MKHARVLLLCAAVLMAGCPEDQVQLVYDQSGPMHNGVVPLVGGDQFADDFILAAGLSMVSRIEWWGTPAPGTGLESLVVRIFDDDGTGRPAIYPRYAIPAGLASRQDTGQRVTAAELPVYRYQADILPIEFEVGTTYYLSIVNESASGWYWFDVADGDDYFYRNILAGTWARRTPGGKLFRLSEL